VKSRNIRGDNSNTEATTGGGRSSFLSQNSPDINNYKAKLDPIKNR